MRTFLRYIVLFTVLYTLVSITMPVQTMSAQTSQPTCASSLAPTFQAATSEQPAHSVITCPFAGNNDDHIIVYDRGGDMRDTGDWRTATDFENDLWVFDAGGDGKANLIIDFHRDGTSLVGDLYDDRDGDANVEYQFEDGRPVITESRYWTVRVVAEDGWWEKDGKVNFNLDIFIDGMVFAMPILVPEIYEKVTKHDGTPDQIIIISDEQQDGYPDLEIRRILSADAYNVVKAIVMKDYGATPVRPQHLLPWPYLGSEHGLVRTPNSFPPPLQIRWNSSSIKFIGEFVASRVDNSRFIYSHTPFHKEDIINANFENPFDFYDLAGMHDGYPDLQIRFETYHAYDPTFQDGTSKLPSTMVRYSWDREHDHLWDYKVTLTGHYAVDAIVQYGDYKLRSVPHEDTPYWVMSRSWPTAHFVQSEQGYASSEGIYTWDTLRVRDGYLSGWETKPDLQEFENIEQGFRGEYTMNLNAQPYLYFSPIDRKLHLLNAQKGLWNIDGIREIRYSNLGGEYINEWLLFEGDEQIKSLRTIEDYIISTENNNVELINTAVEPAIFTTLPPRNASEWSNLDVQLTENERSFDPTDFGAMVAQFSGPTQRVSQASIKDFRLLADGFRFVLELEPDFRVDGDDLLGLAGRQPGRYIISYDGSLSVTPTSPMSLVVELPATTLPQLQRSALQLSLRNDGLEDAPSLALDIQAIAPDGQVTIIMTETVTLLAQSPRTLNIPWAPAQSGTWRLMPRLHYPSGEIAEFEASNITVLPAPSLEPDQLMAQTVSHGSLVSLMIVLLAFTGIAALVGWNAWGSRLEEQAQDDH
jgi:hypothetical protein